MNKCSKLNDLASLHKIVSLTTNPVFYSKNGQKLFLDSINLMLKSESTCR